MGVILQNPVVRAQSDEANHTVFSASDDIVSVYRKMIAAGTNVALIVDRLGRFDGIMTRSAIEGKLIEGLLVASQ